MSDAFLTIDEAADPLRISPRSAYTLAREGRLAGAVKVGNQWRVDRGALMAWVKEEGQTARHSQLWMDSLQRPPGRGCQRLLLNPTIDSQEQYLNCR